MGQRDARHSSAFGLPGFPRSRCRCNTTMRHTVVSQEERFTKCQREYSAEDRELTTAPPLGTLSHHAPPGYFSDEGFGYRSAFRHGSPLCQSKLYLSVTDVCWPVSAAPSGLLAQAAG